MPIHDCETCESRGSCPIESIALWLNEHEEETVSAKAGCGDGLAMACTDLIAAFPPVMLARKSMVLMATACFYLGYHKGRTFQDVPQVFKDSLGK